MEKIYLSPVRNLLSFISKVHESASTREYDKGNPIKNSILNIMDLKKIIRKINRLFHTSCPNCKKGVLHLQEVHIDSFGNKTQVYKCDRCREIFI